MNTLLLLALMPSALALDGNDYLHLTLADGLRVKGWFYEVEDGVLTVSGDGRLVDVSVPTIASVVRNGRPTPLSELLAEIAVEQQEIDAWRANPPPHPQAWMVASANVVCCGAGHAALGDWKGFATYAAVDALLLGTAAWSTFSDDGPGAALGVPLVGLDLFFHGYAAVEAVRTTRERRARLGLRPPRTVESALPRTQASTGLTDDPAD